MKTETKSEILGLGFLGKIMVRIIKPMHAIKIMARGFQPKNPSNTTNRAKLQNTKSNNLTCFKTKQLHKPKKYKHIKTYKKETKTNRKIQVKKERKEKESLD